MTLTLEQLVLGVGGFVIMVLLGIVAHFVRRERDDLSNEIAANEKRAKERHDELSQKQQRMAQDLHQLRDTLPERYVSKLDWVEFRGWLAGMMRRIEDKLDHKADKH